MSLHNEGVERLRKKKVRAQTKTVFCEFVATLTLREFSALFYGNPEFRRGFADHALAKVLCENCTPTLKNSHKLLEVRPSAKTVTKDRQSANGKYTAFKEKLQ